MNSNEQKIVLITSTQTNKCKFKYIVNLSFNILTLFFFYLTLNKMKIQKYKNKVWEIYTYKTPKQLGHPAVNKSLIRGLKKCNIPFKINNLSGEIENVIILWTTYEEFQSILELKKQGKIKRIIVTPECASPENKIKCDFGNNENVDLILVASDWAKQGYIANIKDKNLHERVIPWASGVELPKINKNIQVKNRCICYFKKTPIDNEIIQLCKEIGIETYTIEYLKYRFAEYIRELSNSDFVIFFQNYIETQGLAMAEAWAQNKPTFINYDTNNLGGITSPYLTENTGFHYKDINELKDILIEYKNNPQDFLKKFTPRKWVEENMSDEITVRNLMGIIEKQK